MKEPITCSGNDLSDVCADIRLRGGCIEAMDVIGTAKYRVSYFGRVAECMAAAASQDGTRILEPHSVKYGNPNPVALNHLPKPMNIRNVAAGGEKRAEKPKSVQDAPASISIEDRLAALQSKLLASGKIRRSKPKTEARLPYAD